MIEVAVVRVMVHEDDTILMAPAVVKAALNV
jgi:hypothetical protein